MLQNRNDHSVFRQYLLGQMSGEERDRFEEKLFSDDEFFEDLLATEDELIEAAIGTELTAAEVDQFEKQFLITSERKEKLHFRQALQRVAKKKQLEKAIRPKPAWSLQRWIPQVAVSLVAVVIIGGIVWMLLPRTVGERTLVAAANERAGGRVAETLTLPFPYDDLKLHLTLPQPAIPAKDYRVEMRSTDGQTRALKPVSYDERFVDVVIPVSSLSRGEYAFKVSAIKADSSVESFPQSYLLTVD